MSLSKPESDEFKPLAVNSLESFDDELSHETEGREPDFGRFKLLIDAPAFGGEEVPGFEALYNASEKKEEVTFNPLIKKKEPLPEPVIDHSEQPDQDAEAEDGIEPAETAEQAGYREGFEKGVKEGTEKGFEQGRAQGIKRGEEKGLAQGIEDGIEQGKTQGFEQGFKEGEEKGTLEAQKAATQILNSLEETLAAADRTLNALVDTYEERIIDLICRIAQKAVMAKVEMDEEIVKPLVLDALKHLVQPEEVVLNVSSEDYEYIEMIKDQFFERIESLNSVSVQSDPSVKQGGCRIETNTGAVSTDIETRLQAIFDAVKNAGKV